MRSHFLQDTKTDGWQTNLMLHRQIIFSNCFSVRTTVVYLSSGVWPLSSFILPADTEMNF